MGFSRIVPLAVCFFLPFGLLLAVCAVIGMRARYRWALTGMQGPKRGTPAAGAQQEDQKLLTKAIWIGTVFTAVAVVSGLLLIRYSLEPGSILGRYLSSPGVPGVLVAGGIAGLLPALVVFLIIIRLQHSDQS